MKNSTKTNQSATNGEPLGICRLLLLGTALLGLLPTLQASEWGFNLIGKPSAENAASEGLTEVVQMTGAGKFNPEAGTESGGGSFTFFNAEEAFLGGPTFRGTWKVTDLISWTPDGGPNPGLQGGTLQVRITLFFKAGLNEESKGFTLPGAVLTIICPFVDGQFVESEDAISLDLGFELFAANPTGFTTFHIISSPESKANATFGATVSPKEKFAAASFMKSERGAAN